MQISEIFAWGLFFIFIVVILWVIKTYFKEKKDKHTEISNMLKGKENNGNEINN